MGIMPAYIGRHSPFNPLLNGGHGTYYAEDPAHRAYHTPNLEEAFDELCQYLEGTKTLAVGGVNTTLTLVSFNPGMRLSLPMYVASLETWAQHYALVYPKNLWGPRSKDIPPWKSDKWCNGGDYAESVVNFNELSYASNIRVWGEPRTRYQAAVQTCIDYTNQRFPNGY